MMDYQFQAIHFNMASSRHQSKTDIFFFWKEQTISRSADDLLTFLCLWESERDGTVHALLVGFSCLILNELNIVFWDVPHIKHYLDGPHFYLCRLFSPLQNNCQKDAIFWLKKSLVPKKLLAETQYADPISKRR